MASGMTAMWILHQQSSVYQLQQCNLPKLPRDEHPIVKGLLNECAHLILFFLRHPTSPLKCMELQRKYDRSEPLPPYSWHGQGGFLCMASATSWVPLSQEIHSGTYIHVGPEIGVWLLPRLFTGQVTVLMLLALCVGQMRGTVDDATVERDCPGVEEHAPIYIKKMCWDLLTKSRTCRRYTPMPATSFISVVGTTTPPPLKVR